VIVIGAPDNRLRAAEVLGASTTIPLESTTEAERKQAVWDLTDGRGAEIVIEAAGRMSAFDEGMNLLADSGRYLVLGIYSGHGTVALDPIRLNNRSLAVIGSMGPTQLSDYRTTIYPAPRRAAGVRRSDHAPLPPSRPRAIATARTGEAIAPSCPEPRRAPKGAMGCCTADRGRPRGIEVD
jgi:hypothetical protein